MTARYGCEETLAHLMDFLKRELPPQVAAAVQMHLDECRPCEHQARFEYSFVLLLETRLGRQTCPEALKTRVLDALREEELRG
jgi:mycothiol system anti-sigma-R factor